MKNSFKKALKLYKYLCLLLTIVYWIYIVIDDYGFIGKYWDTNWSEYLVIWTLYFLAYLLGFSIYYWTLSKIIILIYYKLIKTKNDTSNITQE